MRRLLLLLVLLTVSGMLWWYHQQSIPPAIQVIISKADQLSSGEPRWQVQYQLEQPVHQLVFIRNPDLSRASRWQPLDSGFLISHNANNDELIRRHDGAEFTTVSFALTADYVALGKDYAPFSPFTDGGMAWFTGRFKVCPEHCGHSGELRYAFTQQALADDFIRTASSSGQQQLSWLEGADDGQVIYVGPQQANSAWLDSIIDPGLPYALRTSLHYDMPQLLEFFNQRLGHLPRAPMILASYSSTDDGRYGNQGGVIGNQLFVHWYGHSMFERMQEANFIHDTLWFFAHEVGHLYQANGFDNDDAWIHEGAAEFKAYYYLQAQGRSDDYVLQRQQQATDECASTPSGQFQRFYSCGLLIALAMDDQLRQYGHDGLFALWRAYTENLQQRPEQLGKTYYLQFYQQLTSAGSAAQLQQLVAQYFP
jgi:hypothetical protein